SVSAGSALLLDPTAELRFVPGTDFNGTAPALTAHLIDDSAGAIVTGATADLSSTGGTSPYSAGTVALGESITAVNDPVTIGVPTSISGAANGTIAINGLAISDVDAATAPGGVYEVSLAAGHGTMTLGSPSGLVFTVGDGTADGAMTFHGTLSAINAAL